MQLERTETIRKIILIYIFPWKWSKPIFKDALPVSLTIFSILFKTKCYLKSRFFSGFKYHNAEKFNLLIYQYRLTRQQNKIKEYMEDIFQPIMLHRRLKVSSSCGLKTMSFPDRVVRTTCISFCSEQLYNIWQRLR